MVRVAGLLRQAAAGIGVRSADGRTSQVVLSDIRERVIELSLRQSQVWMVDLRKALDAAEDLHRPRRRAGRGRAVRAVGDVRARGVPGSDAAGRRAGPAVPVHLRAIAQPGRARPQPGRRRGAVRPGQGAGGAAAVHACPPGRADGRAGGSDRALPAVALPGDGDRRARRIPRHPRCRLRGVGRGGRPAGGGRARAAPPPVRRRRARRGGRRDDRGHAAAAEGRARRERRADVPDRRHARPGRRQAAGRPRPARPAVRAVGAGHAVAAAPRPRITTSSRRSIAGT